jgi:hypothetical protein
LLQHTKLDVWKEVVRNDPFGYSIQHKLLDISLDFENTCFKIVYLKKVMMFSFAFLKFKIGKPILTYHAKFETLKVKNIIYTIF